MATEMTKTAAQPSVLDLLLSGDIPNVEKELPTAAYKIDRLSDLAGHDVVFKLKALPYGKVHDIERFTQDTEVHILLAGCVEPRRQMRSRRCCWPVRSPILPRSSNG